MKLPYILFIALCLLVSICFGMSAWVFADPSTTAQQFLDDLKTGNLHHAASLMDDNSCQCPPKGGFISFLKYESGLNPNANFLVGAKFQNGGTIVTRLPDPKNWVVPWERPESSDVTAALLMDQPMYFLPIPMAFGEQMTEEQLQDFSYTYMKDVEKGLSLRLRPTLSPGLVHKQPLDKNEEALPQEIKRYLKPADAGPVVDSQGKRLSVAKIQSYLPTLREINLTMNVVRRGQLKPWTIYRFKFSDPDFNRPRAH